MMSQVYFIYLISLIRSTNLQIGWGPPTAHLVCKQPFLLTTGRGGVRFTLYKLDATPTRVHLVNILWTGCLAVRFSNFKKLWIGWLHSGNLTNTTKSTKIKKSYLPVVPCHRLTLPKGRKAFPTVQSPSKWQYLKTTVWKTYLSEIGWCFTVCWTWVERKNTVLFLNQNNQVHFVHSHRGTLRIKLFYRGAGRGYRGGGRICHASMRALASSTQTHPTNRLWYVLPIYFHKREIRVYKCGKETQRLLGNRTRR